MRQMKLVVLKAFCVIFISTLLAMNAFAYFVVNGSEAAFEEPGRTTVRDNVEEAAGYFLKSQSDLLLFLNHIELSRLNGVDYTELRGLINSAIAHMENAKTKYTQLTQIADYAPYHQDTVTALINFNYSWFQENNALNSVIFNDVEAYLSVGDIRGTYHKILADTQSLLDMLTIVKSSVDSDTFPGIADLRRINQSYSETLLFGQYTAEIFSEITGK